jgi:hypothetical protein
MVLTNIPDRNSLLCNQQLYRAFYEVPLIM